MSLSPREYIRHMIDEIEYILRRVEDVDFAVFFEDETLKRAFVRSLEIIGEAAKKIPPDVKAMQPDIEWRKVSGLRDRLIHDYFSIDYAIVWDVAANKLPDLHNSLNSLLRNLDS